MQCINCGAFMSITSTVYVINYVTLWVCYADGTIGREVEGQPDIFILSDGTIRKDPDED